MSVQLPQTLDPWRMVVTGSSFVGALPLTAMPRLDALLASPVGHVDYQLEFGRDAGATAYVAVKVDAALPLTCQRTLRQFEFPVAVNRRLGLIRDDADVVALPGEYEPLLVIDERLDPVAIIEDELLLALPLVPVAPDSTWPAEGREWPAPDAPDEDDHASPFAALDKLNHH